PAHQPAAADRARHRRGDALMVQQLGNAAAYVAGGDGARHLPTGPVTHARPRCRTCGRSTDDIYSGNCWACKTKADAVDASNGATKVVRPRCSNCGRVASLNDDSLCGYCEEFAEEVTPMTVSEGVNVTPTVREGRDTPSPA